jgi:CRP/FNR family transcriptional regulator, cyclic AMP receptor protein
MAEIRMFESARDKIVVPAGERVFSRGDRGDAMYAVLEGAVDIVLGDAVVETVGPGGIIGELALVDESPRSASAVARVDSHLARVDKREFTFLVQEHPTFALQVMQVLAERIRNANESHEPARVQPSS